MRIRVFRHALASLLAISPCFGAFAQTQAIESGCGANVGSVSGNVSINIDCGSQENDPLSVQYVRLFGAAEVPLLMTLFGQPEISKGSPFGRNFHTILGPDGQESIVGANVIQFFNRYSFRNARPLLAKIWTDVAQNDEGPSSILWLASAGSRAERICYFTAQEADSSGHYSELLQKQKLIKNDESCKSIIRKFDRRVGFTFLVIENDGKRPLADVRFLFRQNYTANNILRAEIPDLPDYLKKNEIDTLPDQGSPQYNLMAIYGAASDTELLLKRAPTDWLFAARMEPKEKIIALLNVYIANATNLPAAYLSGIYVFDEIKYSVGGVVKTVKVRPPSMERAARIMVPYGWASQ